jgi:hypothetical protein
VACISALNLGVPLAEGNTPCMKDPQHLDGLLAQDEAVAIRGCTCPQASHELQNRGPNAPKRVSADHSLCGILPHRIQGGKDHERTWEQARVVDADVCVTPLLVCKNGRGGRGSTKTEGTLCKNHREIKAAARTHNVHYLRGFWWLLSFWGSHVF